MWLLLLGWESWECFPLTHPSVCSRNDKWKLVDILNIWLLAVPRLSSSFLLVCTMLRNLLETHKNIKNISQTEENGKKTTVFSFLKESLTFRNKCVCKCVWRLLKLFLNICLPISLTVFSVLEFQLSFYHPEKERNAQTLKWTQHTPIYTHLHANTHTNPTSYIEAKNPEGTRVWPMNNGKDGSASILLL